MPVPADDAREPLLAIEDLSVSIRTEQGRVTVLDCCSIDIQAGEIMGLVGESGCGKSTIVKSILGILPASAGPSGGRILFDGINLLDLDEAALSRSIRGERIGFVPQDPALALNPNFTVGEQFLDIWRWHAPQGRQDKAAGVQRLVELLARVQIADPEEMLGRYPHQFSGGQRQRLLIAAALLCSPRLIIADEPTTALDVTTQQQILILLSQLCRESGISVLFVTHDFGVVSQICDRVSVMYAGQIVEHGLKAEVLRNPRHPYTVALMDCHPDRMTEYCGIPGTVPSLQEMPAGCRFLPRCVQGVSACASRAPRLTGNAGHRVNCIQFDDEPVEAAPA